MTIKDKWMVEIDGSVLMDIIDELEFIHTELEASEHHLAEKIIYPITTLQDCLDNDFARDFTEGEA